ncbi:MAG: hypothetical protein KDA41_02515 [Planctomycetales bacterium]|nr:hypothetical protein [Planctomycetales bacterium]
MSLFENDEYRWRETYFVLLHEEKRPPAEAVVAALRKVNEGYQVQNVRQDDAGRFESLTLYSPDDYAAMDITYVTGDDVAEHTIEIVEQMLPLVAKDERAKLKSLPEYSARLDVYHFEQLVFEGPADDDDMDDFMDPGSLLIVLETLARLTKGVGVDQESGTLI